jgi:hypothetical protein
MVAVAIDLLIKTTGASATLPPAIVLEFGVEAAVSNA